MCVVHVAGEQAAVADQRLSSGQTGVKTGVPDVQIMYRRKPSPRCPTRVVFIELKAPGGAASRSQKRTRLEMLPTGAKWYMARTARAAMMALHLEGVPFRCKWRPSRREPSEGGTVRGPDTRSHAYVLHLTVFAAMSRPARVLSRVDRRPPRPLCHQRRTPQTSRGEQLPRAAARL
jgi:hypothetical protein